MSTPKHYERILGTNRLLVVTLVVLGLGIIGGGYWAFSHPRGLGVRLNSPRPALSLHKHSSDEDGMVRLEFFPVVWDGDPRAILIDWGDRLEPQVLAGAARKAEKKYAPGRYRVQVVVVDSLNRKSRPEIRVFTITAQTAKVSK